MARRPLPNPNNDRQLPGHRPTWAELTDLCLEVAGLREELAQLGLEFLVLAYQAAYWGLGDMPEAQRLMRDAIDG